MKRQWICDARCARCRWSVQLYDKSVVCDYLLSANKGRRPCPAGSGCTEYAPGGKKKAAEDAATSKAAGKRR